MASPLITFTLLISKAFKFSLIIFTAKLLLSIITAEFAYLEIASMLKAPLPPNKSRTFLSTISSPIILNKASLTKSVVGLTPFLGTINFLCLYLPDITLIIHLQNDISY